MRISEVPPFLIIPPLPKKKKEKEPITFCGHLRRLTYIQQRNLMLQKMICWMSRMTDCLRLSSRRPVNNFSKWA